MSRQRSLMTLIGAAGGVSFHGLFQIFDADWLPDRVALALLAFVLPLFLGLTVLSGPLRPTRAAWVSALHAGLVAALVSLAALRFEPASRLGTSGLAMTAAFVLLVLPWPFLITSASPEGWRDYPGLFRESWGIFVRLATALLFTGAFWLTLFLSDALLSLVGLPFLDTLWDWPPAGWILTGASFGLAVAVVDEIAALLSPGLLLRLLRLLLPVLLLVTLVFLIALPLQGLGTLFGRVSAAGTLLLLALVGATLLAATIDAEDASAARAPLLRRAARLQAGLILPPAAIAAWAIGLRVDAHGWTPSRLAAATAAGIALTYGLAYLAVLFRSAWMERIRQVNTRLALGLILLAAAWLSLLNPEAIASRSQAARIAAGQGGDPIALADWGRAGAAALADLQARAKDDPALAARLVPATPPTPDDQRAALARGLQLQPDTAETRGLRDRLLAGAEAWNVETWASLCTSRSGCVLGFADFLPDTPGPEAVLALPGYDVLGFSFPASGLAEHRMMRPGPGSLDAAEIGLLITRLQAAPPETVPAPLRALPLPSGEALIFLP